MRGKSAVTIVGKEGARWVPDHGLEVIPSPRGNYQSEVNPPMHHPTPKNHYGRTTQMTCKNDVHILECTWDEVWEGIYLPCPQCDQEER